MTTTLTPQEIEERAEILEGVDDPCCEACYARVPDGAAADPAWHIDTETRVIHGGRDTETLAIIRCPACW